MSTLKIMLVEDSQSWQGILGHKIKRAIQDIGHASASDIRVIAKFEEAWEALHKEGPWHLLVTDIGLGPSESQQKLGRQLAEYARDLQVPTIAVSGTPVLIPHDVRDLLMKHKVIDFFGKENFDSARFITEVREILQMVYESPLFTYDAFISYSRQDSDWVLNTLLACLEREGLRVCIDSRDFEIGVPSLVNIEKAVEESHKTLLVLTPNWVASQWTEFEALLMQTKDPAGRGRRILPLMVRPCSLPPRLQHLTYLDLTNPEEFDFQMQRLVAAVHSTLIPSTPSEPTLVQDTARSFLPLIQGFSYERGMAATRKLLFQVDAETQLDFAVLESRLLNNLHDERRYGSNEVVRSERSRIMEELNRLTRTSLGRDFNDLCRT